MGTSIVVATMGTAIGAGALAFGVNFGVKLELREGALLLEGPFGTLLAVLLLK
jgi:hypothetical protein